MAELLKTVREEAWNGLIPAEFSMDSSEVTSLQRPLSLYLLLPRMGFLPCVAEALWHHFGEVAPDAHRTLWLEETRSGEPLRWHIPTGVLFDLIAAGQEDGGASEQGVHEGEGHHDSGDGTVVSRSALPWRITVHFQGCPRRQVFPLEKEVDIRRHFTNALKQALYLQSGSSRAGMSLAKDKQTRLWRAVKTNDPKVFHEMNAFLGGDGGLRLVPVRLLRGGAPPSQLPIPTKRLSGEPFTLRDCLSWFCPEIAWRNTNEVVFSPRVDGDGPNASELPSAIPEEDLTTVLKTKITGASLDLAGVGSAGVEEVKGRDQTLLGEKYREGGEGLSRRKQGRGDVPLGGLEGGAGSGAILRSAAGGSDSGDARQAFLLPSVVVQGLEGVPVLDAPIEQLWAALRHPDHFLYIVVRKR